MPLLAPLHADPHEPLPWEPRPFRHAEQVGLGLLLSAIAILVDQSSKQLAAAGLQPQGSTRNIPGPLTLQLTFNDGGAYGFPAPSWIFLVVTAVVTFLVARNLPRSRTLLQTAALSLLLAGAWGNALDRILRVGDPGDPRFLNGHVVDFFASSRLPTFNVADVWILLGFGLLVIAMWREEAAGHPSRNAPSSRRSDHAPAAGVRG